MTALFLLIRYSYPTLIRGATCVHYLLPQNISRTVSDTREPNSEHQAARHGEVGAGSNRARPLQQNADSSSKRSERLKHDASHERLVVAVGVAESRELKPIATATMPAKTPARQDDRHALPKGTVIVKCHYKRGDKKSNHETVRDMTTSAFVSGKRG